MRVCPIFFFCCVAFFNGFTELQNLYIHVSTFTHDYKIAIPFAIQNKKNLFPIKPQFYASVHLPTCTKG